MLKTLDLNAAKKIVTKSAPVADKFNRLHSLSAKDTGKFRFSPQNVQPDKIIFKNFILNAADEEDFSRLRQRFELVSVDAGDKLYAAGEVNNYVYFPETAVLSNLFILADGNTLEIAMIGSEGASGLGSVLGSILPAHQAVVTVEGQAWRIKTEILRKEFLCAGKFQTLMIDYFSNYLAEVSQRVVCESFHLVEQRLCRWLLSLYDRARKNQLRLTHEQIAQFLGISRPTLTMAANTLCDQGLITNTRGKIYILDREKLKASACECYATFQAKF